MNKKKILLTFALCLFILRAFSQNCDLSDNPLVISKENINVNYIEKLILDYKTKFNDEYLNLLKSKINSCNAGFDSKISEIKLNISKNNLAYQEFNKLTDIKEIKQQIEALKKQRENINESIKKNLENINYKGIYIVVLKNIDTYAKLDIYTNDAVNLITPKAVKDLNGTFINSLTIVESSVTIIDYIKSIVSGEMQIVTRFISPKILPSEEMFVYMAEVSVSPLKSAAASTPPYNKYAQNYLVRNPLLDTDYKTKLTNFGLPQSVINEITDNININTTKINNENKAAELKQKADLTAGNQNLKDVEKQISQKQTEFNDKQDKLKKFFLSHNMTYDTNNLESCINKANYYFYNLEKGYQEEIKKVLENRLEVPQYNIKVTTEAGFANDIAKKAVDVINGIKKDYAVISGFIEVTEVENAVTKDYQVGTKKDIYREVEKIWLFPKAGEDMYYLTVIAKFKIKDVAKTSPAITTELSHAGTKETLTDQTSPTITTTTTTHDYDGNVYKTVTIGTQVWMAENLKTTHYRDGTAIPNVTDKDAWSKLTSGAYCNYANDENKVSTYGRLYNWYAVNTGKLCPSGWHIPTDAEWTTLTNYLGGESVAGGKLKSTTNWNSPNTRSTNSSGFTTLPGGYRGYNGTFLDIGDYGDWWSSTENDAANAWKRSLYYYDADVYRGNYSKSYGFSVRCLRD